ncbi:unnamed protein product [Phaedon cochleariae]|uniref:Tetraspanin n=1 Tax=Phaedon cochleariae TaxID=80249 RepID=A0A9N9X4P3_PHACE|nr:unnamed protein product [Phaedon cochleariae]
MGSQCCGPKVIEIILYIFQVLLLITGVAICVLGSWNFMITFHFTRVLDNHVFTSTVYLFLVVGCLVILVFFLGCCAIPKRWTKLLFCYIILLVAIFLCEVLICILAFVYQGNIAEDMKVNFKETIVNSYKSDDSKTDSIDYIQENLHCCGSFGFYDWSANSWIHNETVKNLVPDSCCKTISFECGFRDHPSNINVEGCMEIIIKEIQMNFWLLFLITLGLSVTHVIGIVCGIMLFLKLESNKLDDNNYSPQGGSGKETLLPEREQFL